MQSAETLERHDRAPIHPTPTPALGVVHSHDEWSPLEEVIVGRVDGAHVPAWHPTLEATMPEEHQAFLRREAGRPFPAERVAAAARELDALARTLEREGVVVRRPEAVDWGATYATPDFGPTRGLYAAMPRDLLLVVGEEIIEAPMAWRCRLFESRAYRPLIKEYFARGARWTAAPRPQLCDALYAAERRAVGFDLGAGGSVVTEFEPVFDAADFMRCGRHIFCQLSHVTNRSGIEWLRRHLGADYEVHVLAVDDPHAMHLDATFVPLAPGKLLVNPSRPPTLPPMFASWEVFHAPPPAADNPHPYWFTSRWLSMNVLSLDERRVIVEAEERATIDMLRARGFEPIPVPFRHFGSFGGGFHCATSDVRRRSRLADWF
jgi:glycine amidinotransferase